MVVEKKAALEAVLACNFLSVAEDEPSWPLLSPAFLEKAMSLVDKFTYNQCFVC